MRYFVHRTVILALLALLPNAEGKSSSFWSSILTITDKALGIDSTTPAVSGSQGTEVDDATAAIVTLLRPTADQLTFYPLLPKDHTNKFIPVPGIILPWEQQDAETMSATPDDDSLFQPLFVPPPSG